MHRRTRVSMLGVSALAATLACLATNARCQSLDSILNTADKAKLDLSATRVAQKIREAQLTEKPKALVIGFFRGSVGSGQRSARVLESPNRTLSDQAIESVRNWKFKPAISPGGQPLEVRVPTEITFTLYQK